MKTRTPDRTSRRARTAAVAAAAHRPSPTTRQSWDTIRARLRDSLPETTWEMWISPLKPVAVRGEVLHLTGPAPVCTWVERRFSSLVVDAAATSGTGVKAISFDPPAAERESVPVSPPVTNPTHTFSRFVIGPGNHLAHAAALAVAEAPAEAYNPLLIHGSPGLGKTHLLGAIANYLELHAPELDVLHTSAENFTTEFITAIREDGTAAFKRRHRHLDVLLIDDVQFIAGKERTEEELFHTFNCLHEAGSQIVLSADRPPSEISTLADRLSDRFEWGLTVPVEAPDLATRLTVLRHLVSEARVEIPDQEALTLLARGVRSNMRKLRGTLTRVLAEASLEGGAVTADLVRSVLPNRVPDPAVPITPELIRETVAEYAGLDVAALCGRRRDHATRNARNLAIFITREATDLSLPGIGRLYGDRDHSTVLNSIRRVESAIGSDPDLTTAVETVRARIHRPAERD